MSVTIKSVLSHIIPALSQSGSDTPRLDAEVLLAYILQKDRAWLYAHNDFLLPAGTEKQFNRLIQRRVCQEPVAYIVGEQEFYGHPFYVTPHVLIPRPETELLVETALELIEPGDVVIDIGTGSGCIAITLALHFPEATFIASDISPNALAIARHNAHRHAVSNRIAFLGADLLNGVKGKFNVLVSNPPYVSVKEMAMLSPGVKDYEPSLALMGGCTGLMIIEKILLAAATKIKPGGALLVEFGAGQGAQSLALAARLCPYAHFEIKQDLAHRDRLLIGRF